MFDQGVTGEIVKCLKQSKWTLDRVQKSPEDLRPSSGWMLKCPQEQRKRIQFP